MYKIFCINRDVYWMLFNIFYPIENTQIATVNTKGEFWFRWSGLEPA